MKYRLAIGALVAVALQVWIIRLGIFGVPKPPGVPSMWSRVPRLSNPASATDAPGVAVAVAPLPSVDQSMKFWSDAERTGRLDTNLAVKKYFFDLALNHRIPVKASSGAVVGEIVVPGDVSGLNWNTTDTQFARLAESGVPVEITPPMLQELKLRRDKFLALSKIPFSGPPPERMYPQKNGLAETLRNIMTDTDLGQAFLCTDTPLYKFSLSTAPPGGPSWMNKKPALVAHAGTQVFKVAVFGNSGIIRNETRIKLVQSPSAPSYFVLSNWLKDSCAP